MLILVRGAVPLKVTFMDNNGLSLRLFGSAWFDATFDLTG